MPPAAESVSIQDRTTRLGIAWIALCAAMAVHVTDEALTGFLSVYNPTVVAQREKFGFWPMPPFEFRDWLTGLIVVNLVLFAFSPFVFSRACWIRPVFYVFAVIMFFNGLGHTAGTTLDAPWLRSAFRVPCPASLLLRCCWRHRFTALCS
jgi:hypothetical protein